MRNAWFFAEVLDVRNRKPKTKTPPSGWLAKTFRSWLNQGKVLGGVPPLPQIKINSGVSCSVKRFERNLLRQWFTIFCAVIVVIVRVLIIDIVSRRDFRQVVLLQF